MNFIDALRYMIASSRQQQGLPWGGQGYVDHMAAMGQPVPQRTLDWLNRPIPGMPAHAPVVAPTMMPATNPVAAQAPAFAGLPYPGAESNPFMKPAMPPVQRTLPTAPTLPASAPMATPPGMAFQPTMMPDIGSGGGTDRFRSLFGRNM